MALVGNISGSASNLSNIGITGSVVIANRPDALFPTLAGVGSDVVFFVSGSRGGKGGPERTVSVFGGDSVISGSLTIGTGSIVITSNDITFNGGIAQILSGAGGLTLKDGAGEITVSSIIAGSSAQPVYWTSNVADQIFTTGSITAVNGTFSGDLTVNGTTTTVNTQNLLVKDPVIYFGSGSVGSNRDGGIALASGSSVTDQSLVWGRVANDTWGAGRLDVQNGTVTNVSGMTLLPVRASKFELGGVGAFLTSSNGGIAEIRSTNDLVVLNAGSGQAFDFKFNNAGFAELRDVGIPRFGAVLGKDLQISGSNLILNAGLSGVDFQINNSPYAKFSTRATNDAQFGALSGRQLYLSGSRVSIDAGSDGQYLQFNGNDIARAYTGGPNRFDLETQGPVSIANIVNASATTVNLGGAATTLNIGNAGGISTVRGAVTLPGSLDVQGLTALSGSVVLGDNAVDNVTFTGRVNSDVLPAQDVAHSLGGPNLRWANIYTGDLHLKNDRGDWTIIEEEEFLSITNNKTGKRYKFVVEEI